MFGSDAGSYLFHYTKLETALEHILPTQRLRLSPFSQMRDPRESHLWWTSGTSSDPIPPEDDTLFRLMEALQEQKAEFKVLSLAREEGRPPPYEVFGRGFARPRLWEQYAQNHRGVCLCFDRVALIASLEEQLQPLGHLSHGDVAYRDAPIAPGVLHFDLPEARSRGVDAVVRELLDRHVAELFFKKLADWETEFEYRFVVRIGSPDAVEVSVAGPLRGVVLGALVSNVYVAAFDALCNPHGISLGQLHWRDGQPHVVPSAGGGISILGSFPLTS